MASHRSIEESPLFLQQLQELGDIRYLDQALEGAVWAIATTPEGYPKLPDTNIQRIKTRDFGIPGRPIPPMEIWFVVLSEDKVRLLAIFKLDVLDLDVILDEGNF
jgi:hypothetical protein